MDVLHPLSAGLIRGIHIDGRHQFTESMEIEITTDWLKDDIGTIKRVPIITSKT